MPNHPSATHGRMPRMPEPNASDADQEAWAAFKQNPDKTFLSIASTKVRHCPECTLLSALALRTSICPASLNHTASCLGKCAAQHGLTLQSGALGLKLHKIQPLCESEHSVGSCGCRQCVERHGIVPRYGMLLATIANGDEACCHDLAHVRLRSDHDHMSSPTIECSRRPITLPFFSTRLVVGACINLAA